MVPTCAAVRGNHPWPSRLIRRRIGREKQGWLTPTHRTSAHSHAAAWANFATQFRRNQLCCDPREKYILVGSPSPPRLVADFTLFPFPNLRILVLDSQLNKLSLSSRNTIFFTNNNRQQATPNNDNPHSTMSAYQPRCCKCGSMLVISTSCSHCQHSQCTDCI